MEEHLLEVRNVTKVFGGGLFRRDAVVAIDDVSLALPADEPRTMTIAGESGSGKTTLALAVLGLLPPTSGKILFRGTDIQKMESAAFMKYRREVQPVFQNPYEVFNPFYRIDHVFDIVINRFRLARSKSEARRITAHALEVVRLDPDEILGRYSHQLSGGQLQRIMIARAFLLKPRLIVADEPVSMIDVSIRAIILDIMVSLKKEFGISQLYITHDLSTALQISDEILITYRGSIVERGDAEAVIQNPKHPYTQLLINSIPLPDPDRRWTKPLELVVEDEVTVVTQIGCKFYDRCPFRMRICLDARPPLYRVGQNHDAACYLYRDSETIREGDLAPMNSDESV
jgi:oligopeptide/dipeptide ABC transporter ATP-binding protein